MINKIQQGWMDTSRKVVRPLEFLSFIMKPFVNLLTWSTNVMLAKVLKGNVIGPQVTEEEIHAMIEEGSESGVIDPQERDMVKNVFRLDDRQISSLMTPRSEIEWINLDDPQQVKIDKILNSHRSRLVVQRVTGYGEGHLLYPDADEADSSHRAARLQQRADACHLCAGDTHRHGAAGSLQKDRYAALCCCE